MGCRGEGVVGAIGVAGGLSAEGAGLGVELEGDDGGLLDGASGHLDELPDGLLVEGGEWGVESGEWRVESGERRAGGEEEENEK